MQSKTACPLDCFDACSVVHSDGKLHGDKEHILTRGGLCPHLNHFLDVPRIEQPRYKGEPVSMEEALERLIAMIGEEAPKRTLLYRGSGNMGLMQQSTDFVLGSYGATLTKGSLCDGAGEAGIIEGRGANYLMAPEEIAKADVVVLWGRNPHVSSPHLLPYISGKTLIVIDPCLTEAARAAELHIQLKPHGDLYLAMLLARFAIIQGHEDTEFLEEHTEDHQDYYELTQTVRIKNRLEQIDVTLGQIGKVLELMEGKKTAILVGTGVQKYRSGAEVVRAIDSFAAIMGLFGKEGCGVSYLGSSMQGIDNPFATKAPRVGKADTPFGEFNTVLIQGANPLAQMPETQRVKSALKNVKNVVYFGLYENETSEAADLVIPAKSFLEKEDIRASYGSDEWLRMPKQCDGTAGIGEYELASRLAGAFGVTLQDEAYYIAQFVAQCEERSGRLMAKGRSQPPYADGFDTDEGTFVFLDEYDSDFDMENGLFLLTNKQKKSLNSQFRREHRVFLHPGTGFTEGSRVRVVSPNGAAELEVAHDDRLRGDCVLIHAGTPGVNLLTSSKKSYDGESAAYQETKVKVEPC